MLVNTHMLIGQSVYENIQRVLNINLNKSKFIYGNVKPDIVYKLATMSHCMKDSLCFVLEEISNLLVPDEKDLDQFSIDLGVINHYLSDFFCSAHYYPERFNSFIKHIDYEYNLHKAFKKLQRDKLLNLSKLQVDRFNKGTIIDTIFVLERLYKKENINVEKDIFYALRISTLASIYILENSSLIYRKAAA